MKLRIVLPAEDELREAATWYEQRLPGLGSDFIDEVENALERIRSAPDRFALLESLPAADNVRRLLLDRFPFAVVFEFDSAEIRVLAIAHTRRKPGYWKSRS